MTSGQVFNTLWQMIKDKKMAENAEDINYLDDP